MLIRLDDVRSRAGADENHLIELPSTRTVDRVVPHRCTRSSRSLACSLAVSSRFRCGVISCATSASIPSPSRWFSAASSGHASHMSRQLGALRERAHSARFSFGAAASARGGADRVDDTGYLPRAGPPAIGFMFRRHRHRYRAREAIGRIGDVITASITHSVPCTGLRGRALHASGHAGTEHVRPPHRRYDGLLMLGILSQSTCIGAGSAGTAGEPVWIAYLLLLGGGRFLLVRSFGPTPFSGRAPTGPVLGPALFVRFCGHFAPPGAAGRSAFCGPASTKWGKTPSQTGVRPVNSRTESGTNAA